MRGALRRGQPACLVTPSHLNVARRPSLRCRPSRFRNLRVPSPCAPPQAGSPSLICSGQRRSRTDPQSWWPWGTPVGSSLHPIWDIQRRVSLASCLDGKRGKEILPRTAPSARPSWHYQKCPLEEDCWGAGIAGPQMWTQLRQRGVCYTEEDGWKLCKPSVLPPE